MAIIPYTHPRGGEFDVRGDERLSGSDYVRERVDAEMLPRMVREARVLLAGGLLANIGLYVAAAVRARHCGGCLP